MPVGKPDVVRSGIQNKVNGLPRLLEIASEAHIILKKEARLNSATNVHKMERLP